jgi:hypothetical protein
MLKKAAAGSASTPVGISRSRSSSNSSSKELHAGLQNHVMHLEKELELERQRHGTTAACLTQEQEMLAVLAIRLAAVETTAGHATCDTSELQQLLQEEQQLHDMTMNALNHQLRVAQQLRQQLSSLALTTTTSTAAAAAGLGRTGRQFAFRAVCVLTGIAAAAAFPIKWLPPAVLSPAAPAATAIIAAEATTVALRALGWLASLLHCNKRQQQQHWVPGAATAISSAAVSAWAAGPVSFNCWEFGDVWDEMAYGTDLCSHWCFCSDDDSSSSSSSRSSSSSSRDHDTEEVDEYVILPWDDIQSEMSYDLYADSSVIVSEPRVMVDAACQCGKAGNFSSSACLLPSKVKLAQQQQQQQQRQQQQQQQQGPRHVHAGILYLAPQQG